MKVNNIISVILALAIIIGGICAVVFVNKETDTSNFYALTTVVKEIDETRHIVTCVDFNGNEWKFGNSDDWYVGDYCALLMYDNGTDDIHDDEIVKETYCGWLNGEFGYDNHVFVSYND